MDLKQEALSHFKLIRSLGKGGMGEVFLAYDEICQREVALKRIRPDLLKYEAIHKRFLKEAKIAAALSHPSIIPIFSISESYYTMPYVEGKTLKQMLTKDTPISSLLRIFLNVAQAIAYCHSKNVLHRDLKPDNIIVGKFGEVLILDWGLAQHIGEKEESVEIPERPSLTRPGKVVGTLAYLAPERILEKEASFQTDLYSLGVILYQMLTLKIPFKRGDLATSKKMVGFEESIDPAEAAPYREIPSQLSLIVQKALKAVPEERYKNVSDLITDLENHIEGHPEWLLTEELYIKTKECWEFQENVLLAKHIAITRSTDVMEWALLMISKNSFGGNIRLKTSIKLRTGGNGIGFLLSIPPFGERKDLMDGYCLWIGSEKNPGLKLFKSNVEMLFVPDVFLKEEETEVIQIDKTDNRLRLFLGKHLCCDYTSISPFKGSHIGLICKDAHFEIEPLQVFTSSQNLTISCLSVADALLSAKKFPEALSEYRRIAHSFPGREEATEAIFRAGTALTEEAHLTKKSKTKSHLFSLALEEFNKLHTKASGPLEYLGKSLVYKSMEQFDEEIKCLELAIRKYQKHPLLPRLIEHIIFRLHEAARYHRRAAYELTLLTLRLLPHVFESTDNQMLLHNLEKNWEPLPFLEGKNPIIHLSFLLAKPLPLIESIENNQNASDAFFALLELRQITLLKESPLIEIKQALLSHKVSFKKALEQENLSPRARAYILQRAIDSQKSKEVLPFFDKKTEHLHIRALLSLHKWKEAGELFETHPLEELTDENSPFYPLFICYLWATEGGKISKAHFSGFLETPYPRTSALLSYFLTKKITLKDKWFKQAFPYEKLCLYRDLALFYRCTGNPSKAKFFEKKHWLTKGTH